MPRFPTRPALAFPGALMFLGLALGACTPAATVRVSPTATATTPPAPGATPASTPVPDWQGFTDPTFGFTLEMPGVFWVDPNAQPRLLSATDSATLFVYRELAAGESASPTARLLAASGGLFISYASTAPPAAPCRARPCRSARARARASWAIGTTPWPPRRRAGLPRWKEECGSSRAACTSASPLGAGGQPTASAYWAAYGPIWQHILASFVAGPATGAHPCG